MVPIAPRKSLEPWLFDSVSFYNHQVEGIRELAKRTSFLLADDMGLGKSLQAITVFAIDVYRGWASTCIVVCPPTLKGNWLDEFQKFTRIPAVILEGTPARRLQLLGDFKALDGPKVLIVNYEQLIAHLADLNAFNFDVGIYDEAHYIKNQKSKRTKAALALETKRNFMLTGTPMLNQVNELWPILHKINSKRWPKYWTFVNRHCVFGGYQNHQIVGVKNERELTESLSAVMMRRLKKDVLDLPDVQYIERRVELTHEQKILYDQVKEELKLTVIDESKPQDIDNALTKFLRLKQICGTTYQFTGEDFSSKLDVAVEDAIELLRNGHKIVVFTQFRSVLERFCVRLDKEAPQFDIFELHGDIKMEDRQPIVKTWSNESKPCVLACMLQVAGIGLNMTASRHALFLDKLFVPGLNQQAVDRLHRIGADTVQPIQVLEYICRSTIENRVNQILKIKTKIFGNIVEGDVAWKKKLYKALLEEDESE